MNWLLLLPLLPWSHLQPLQPLKCPSFPFSDFISSTFSLFQPSQRGVCWSLFIGSQSRFKAPLSSSNLSNPAFFYQWRCWHSIIVFPQNNVQMNPKLLSHCSSLNQGKKKCWNCCIKKKSLRSRFAVWDHTRTIMAYWPSSVSRGTGKPFLPLLRLESYLILFYFGKSSCRLSGNYCCYSKDRYLSHHISLSYHYL